MPFAAACQAATDRRPVVNDNIAVGGFEKVVEAFVGRDVVSAVRAPIVIVDRRSLPVRARDRSLIVGPRAIQRTRPPRLPP